MNIHEKNPLNDQAFHKLVFDINRNFQERGVLGLPPEYSLKKRPDRNLELRAVNVVRKAIHEALRRQGVLVGPAINDLSRRAKAVKAPITD